MTGYIHVQYQHHTLVNTMKSAAKPRYVSGFFLKRIVDKHLNRTRCPRGLKQTASHRSGDRCTWSADRCPRPKSIGAWGEARRRQHARRPPARARDGNNVSVRTCQAATSFSDLSVLARLHQECFFSETRTHRAAASAGGSPWVPTPKALFPRTPRPIDGVDVSPSQRPYNQRERINKYKYIYRSFLK
jgi:hypothetical protein